MTDVGELDTVEIADGIEPDHRVAPPMARRGRRRRLAVAGGAAVLAVVLVVIAAALRIGSSGTTTPSGNPTAAPSTGPAGTATTAPGATTAPSAPDAAAAPETVGANGAPDSFTAAVAAAAATIATAPTTTTTARGPARITAASATNAVPGAIYTVLVNPGIAPRSAAPEITITLDGTVVLQGLSIGYGDGARATVPVPIRSCSHPGPTTPQVFFAPRHSYATSGSAVVTVTATEAACNPGTSSPQASQPVTVQVAVTIP